MTELDREAMRILEIAREARTPSAADRVRVGRRLGAALGTGVAAQLAAGQAEAAAGELATGAAASQAPAAAAGTAAAKALLTSATGAWTLAGVSAVGALIGGYVAVATLAPTPRLPDAAPQASAAPARAPAPEQPAAVIEAAAIDSPSVEDPVAPDAPSTTAAPASSEPRPHRAGHTARGSLARELKLLHRARDAWQRGDAEHALSLLQRHRARYPHSDVATERDALRVLSLCELERTGEARRLARTLLQRAPASPLRAAVERSCASE